VNALVISRIDYCNAVLTGVHDIHLQRLQGLGVLTAAARLIVRKKKHDSITSTLRRPALVADSTCRLQARCTHVQLPAQLDTRLLDYGIMCHAVSENPGRHNLCSAERRDLMVPPTRTVRYGPRSFAAAGPSIWNSLPTSLRNQQLSVTSFRRHLKTELYCRAYNIGPLAHL